MAKRSLIGQERLDVVRYLAGHLAGQLLAGKPLARMKRAG